MKEISRKLQIPAAVLAMGLGVLAADAVSSADPSGQISPHVIECLNDYASLPNNEGLQAHVLSASAISISANIMDTTHYADAREKAQAQPGCDNLHIQSFTDVSVYQNGQLIGEEELIPPGNNAGGEFKSVMSVNPKVGCNSTEFVQYNTYAFSSGYPTLEQTQEQHFSFQTTC